MYTRKSMPIPIYISTTANILKHVKLVKIYSTALKQATKNLDFPVVRIIIRTTESDNRRIMYV